MKKKWYLLLALALLGGTKSMAQDAKKLFIEMPDSIFQGILNHDNRADCFDFLDSKMQAKIKNSLQETSEMKAYGANFVKMQLSENVQWQMVVLPLPDHQKVIATITSVFAPVCDSKLKVYDASWKELPTEKFISLPQKSDFLHLPQGMVNDALAGAYKAADISLLQMECNPQNNQMAIYYRTPEYMSIEQRKLIQPYLQKKMVFEWKGSKWEKAPTSTKE